jgi:hypothetical protein
MIFKKLELYILLLIYSIYKYLPYFLRVKIKKIFFTHYFRKNDLIFYLKNGISLYLNNNSYLIYIIESYIKFFKIKSFSEIGFFSGIITRILINKNYDLKYFGFDFDKDRILFLKNYFKKTIKYKIIKLDLLDIEKKINYQKLKKIDIVYFGSVLSSIQPEKLSDLFSALKKASIKIIIIHDYKFYRKNKNSSQIKLKSIYHLRNWMHDYLQYAKGYYKSNIVIPDVSDPFGTSNSLYIMSNNVKKETHQRIVLNGIKKFHQKNN